MILPVISRLVRTFVRTYSKQSLSLKTDFSPTHLFNLGCLVCIGPTVHATAISTVNITNLYQSFPLCHIVAGGTEHIVLRFIHDPRYHRVHVDIIQFLSDEFT